MLYPSDTLRITVLPNRRLFPPGLVHLTLSGPADRPNRHLPQITYRRLFFIDFFTPFVDLRAVSSPVGCGMNCLVSTTHTNWI